MRRQYTAHSQHIRFRLVGTLSFIVNVVGGTNQHGTAARGNKRADLVLWDRAFFGVKPEMVLMGGSIACAQMGDPNASIPTPQPVYSRPMFASFGRSLEKSSNVFVSQMSLEK